MSRLSITLISLLILLDLISKHYIQKYLLDYPIRINDYLILDIYYNKGVAFSFLDSDSIVMNYLVTLIVAGVILYIFSIFVKNYKNLNNIDYSAYILILGGALGNFLDRFINQSVMDFIIIHYEDVYFPGIFNIADMFITIGVIMLLTSYFIYNKKYD